VTVLSSEPNTAREPSVATAKKVDGPLDADGFPASEQWSLAPAYKFDADWQGKNADPQRATTVQLLFTLDTLFVRFAAQYRTITVFADSDKGGRRYQLWDRDVAEVFLQPDSSDPWRYKEFEVSPNGFWVDLDISHGENQNLHSGLQRRVSINEKTKTWFAELALPMKSITTHFNPKDSWAVNFFRVEGPAEPRFYSCWRPTNSPQPNFHVPEAFGILRFE
jgi:alpha-galactosidase